MRIDRDFGKKYFIKLMYEFGLGYLFVIPDHLIQVNQFVTESTLNLPEMIIMMKRKRNMKYRGSEERRHGTGEQRSCSPVKSRTAIICSY